MPKMPCMALLHNHTPFDIDSGRAKHLCRELEDAGLESTLQVDIDGATTSGVALSVAAPAISESSAVAMQLSKQASDVLAAGLPLTVSVHSDAGVSVTSGQLRFVCELLRSARLDVGAPSGQVGIAVDASSLPPVAAWQLRNETLGDGPLYLLCGADQSDGVWSSLWQLRGNDMTRLVCAPVVTSPCHLLSAEIANGVIPVVDIQAPTGSAWITMSIDVSRFADGTGLLDDAAFEQALRCAVELGDELHALSSWPTAQMRHDAWLNRRLAINVTGIGTLLQARDLDPGRFTALHGMCRLLDRVREVVHDQSRRLANAIGNVPALEQTNPGQRLPGGHIRDGWARRWRHAVEAAATRHRNLLVISPWSLFPAGERADFRYSNLLPLLRYADACAFPPAPDLSGWGVKDFKSFHQRALAVIHQRDHMRQIAERA